MSSAAGLVLLSTCFSVSDCTITYMWGRYLQQFCEQTHIILGSLSHAVVITFGKQSACSVQVCVVNAYSGMWEVRLFKNPCKAGLSAYVLGATNKRATLYPHTCTRERWRGAKSRISLSLRRDFILSQGLPRANTYELLLIKSCGGGARIVCVCNHAYLYVLHVLCT